VFFDFGDQNTLKRLIAWQPANSSEATGGGPFIDSQAHTYTRYGTYYVNVTYANNVSQYNTGVHLEVDECIRGFQVTYEGIS
jgi:hypothetical protein